MCFIKDVVKSNIGSFEIGKSAVFVLLTISLIFIDV